MSHCDFLAAPPATGKSTLGALIESEVKARNLPLQVIGMYGLHYCQSYILSHDINRDGKIPMKDVKGCLETFNVEKLKEKLQMLIENDMVL